MNISQILGNRTPSAATSSQTTTQAAAAAAADPITARINQSTTKLQAQLTTATANLSTLGKFKAAVSATQTSAMGLTRLKDASTSDEAKTALAAFVSDFNSMVTSTQAAAADTSGVNTISRGMTRAMTADFSKVSALRQIGFTKASDGSLKLDTAKFELYLGTVSAGLGSLALEFRERIALAMGVSTVLASFGSTPLRLPRRVDAWVRRLSNSSYALFLVHFSVLLLANALWAVLEIDDTDWALPFTALAWALALLASYAFHTQVELRIAQWRSSSAALPAQAAK